MTGLAERAERIAAHLVGYETGAEVVPHDIGGRQSAVDYLLCWPDGRQGALEVTLVTDRGSIVWQGMAMKEGWRWPAASSWEFRSAAPSFPYKLARRVALRAVELCDLHGVDRPEELPVRVLEEELELAEFLADEFGTLRRTRLDPGISIYQPVRAEFVDNAPSDFARVVEAWHGEPHMASHLKKLAHTAGVSERHLFLVPTDDVLPVRFFADDFAPPFSAPAGFDSVDSLWIWSNYWHRYLAFRNGSWAWVDFPHAIKHKKALLELHDETSVHHATSAVDNSARTSGAIVRFTSPSHRSPDVAQPEGTNPLRVDPEWGRGSREAAPAQGCE